MGGNFEQAKEFFVQGLAHYQAGRLVQAERAFAASLALLPGRVSTLTNLGAVRLKLGRIQEAADLLAEALAQEPGNVEALGHRAAALAELGQPTQALACAERALELDPGMALLWTLRGTLQTELGRPDQARDAFRMALTHGGEQELNRYYLAALGGHETPATAPRTYVQALFDGYAEGFEAHLVQVLKYRAPERLTTELRRMGRRFGHALDLGCGTGLCGLALRPLADQLTGVDLSANMVDQARRRGVYDQVVQADLVQFLATGEQRYDLVLAADVFIYVGALEPVFADVFRRMEPGGIFCFCVELAHEPARLVLRPSLRYAHSRGYIQSLAEQYGFEIAATAEHPIREDQRTPIPGLFAWLVRP